MPISTVYILKYVWKCYVKWFSTILSLGCPWLTTVQRFTAESQFWRTTLEKPRRQQSMKINHCFQSIKINKNLLINIDWLSIQIDNHSPMRLNFIDFYWLLFIINSWLCNSKNPERHSVLKPWLNVVANTATLLCLRKFLFPIASRNVCVCCWCVTF